MVTCIANFLDFCYLARRPSHDSHTIEAMQDLLERFVALRTVFEVEGVRLDDGFSLPRQHSILHYPRGIQLFGSPNGLCSSITESKHITAIKQPWRESNRRNPIGQIIRKITRENKLAAARSEFGRRNMLYGDVLTHARLLAGIFADSDESEDDEDEHAEDPEDAQDVRFRDLADAAAAGDEDLADGCVDLSQTPGACDATSALLRWLLIMRTQRMSSPSGSSQTCSGLTCGSLNVFDAICRWSWTRTALTRTTSTWTSAHTSGRAAASPCITARRRPSTPPARCAVLAACIGR